MYRFNKETSMSFELHQRQCAWDVNAGQFAVRAESNAVQAFAELEFRQGRDERRSPSESGRSRHLDRDGRRSPYGSGRDRSRRVTMQRASQRLVNGMAMTKYAEAAMMFRDDSAQAPIQVDPVGKQEREDILMTM